MDGALSGSTAIYAVGVFPHPWSTPDLSCVTYLVESFRGPSSDLYCLGCISAICQTRCWPPAVCLLTTPWCMMTARELLHHAVAYTMLPFPGLLGHHMEHKFSASKSAHMLIAGKQTPGASTDVLLSGAIVPQVSCVRHLGVHLSSYLSWTPHIPAVLS